ncbi:hypothetical protein ABPG74_021378 [Tetrahymena malaccensis]
MYNNRNDSKELSQKTLVEKYSGLIEEIQKKQNHLNIYDNYSPILISKQKIKFQEENEFNNSQISQVSQNCSIMQLKQCQDQSLNQNSYIDNELNAIFHQAKKNRDFGSTFTLTNTGYSLKNSRYILMNSQINSQRSLRCSKSMHQQSQNEIEQKNNSPRYEFYKHSYSRSRSNKNLKIDSQIIVQNERQQQSQYNQYDYYLQPSIKKDKIMSNLNNQQLIKSQITIKNKQQEREELQYTYEKSKKQMNSYKRNEQISYQIQQQIKNLNDTKEILDNARINNDCEDIQFQSQRLNNNKNVIFDRSLESTSKHNIENKENEGANYYNLSHKNNFLRMEDQIQQKKKSEQKMHQLSQTKQNNDSIIEFDPHQETQQSKYGFIKHKEQFYKSRKFKAISQQCVEVEIIMPTEKCNKSPIIHHQNKNPNSFQGKQEGISSDLSEELYSQVSSQMKFLFVKRNNISQICLKNQKTVAIQISQIKKLKQKTCQKKFQIENCKDKIWPNQLNTLKDGEQTITNQSHFTSQSTQNNIFDRHCASTAQTYRDQNNSNYVDLGLFCSSNTINSIQIKQRSESILSFNKSTESLQNNSQQTQLNIPQFWHSHQQIKQQK